MIPDLYTLKSLDAHLVSRTFLVSNYLTAADVAVYGALHPVIVRPGKNPLLE
jgi:aminoacyl tRNA synthase complex-interacting multifunctional protein 1